ncbi:MAG TPA: aldo/keto reductase [Gaiellaceae bacterium]|nr:aldo/keto reductase [Gaiellaceae bacterium]
MRTRTLGSSDLAVSVVGLGCNNFGWRLDAAGSKTVIDAAIDAGITFLDTAEMYGDGESEEFIGRALGDRRDRVVIATKFGWGNGSGDTSLAPGSAEQVRVAIEGSLRRLRTDYVDLYQYHRPDGVTPIVETLGAMNELVDEGKVRSIGSSNMSAAQIREADAAARDLGLASFVSVQNEYSWLVRDVEAEVVPACEELGLGLIPYFPLARGLLTGKYRRDAPVPDGTRLSGSLDVDDATWDRLEALEAFAAERGITLLDLAIGGLAAQPAVASVIAGATKPEQVRANAAAGAWEPTAEDLTALRSL